MKKFGFLAGVMPIGVSLAGVLAATDDEKQTQLACSTAGSP